MEERSESGASASGRSASGSADSAPIKGILKKNGGKAQVDGAASGARRVSSARGEDEHGKKSQKWDEMNIIATYHPAGKDYGLMKIDEPATPYRSMVGEDDEDAVSDTEENEPVRPDVLSKKLAAAAEGKGPKIMARQEESSEEEEEDEELTPEEREKKKQFEMKRKMHYNEGRNIKLARQLIAKELQGEEDDEDEDEEMDDAADVETMETEVAEHAHATCDQLESRAHSIEEICPEL
ncbi:LOW QUALITY PROTEIN: protein phosphatase inhibitor 2 [Melopsittacus undulatus]|uniref:LOW QUALITY PROTEIN: protein phosphatase inhibitor 2 n=1 Tax=Melopsittacus undulatus TaxID=13146 RepID=UPI00146D5269|nr:LOW QUALITY PROTEIN: protein phosphatase inhibitor 2 [Melopsittacus undulatus]